MEGDFFEEIGTMMLVSISTKRLKRHLWLGPLTGVG